MHIAGPLFDELFRKLDADTDDKKAAIRRTLNLAYIDIARKAPFLGLRVMGTEFDFSEQDSDGLLMPANVAGIMAVYNTANGIYQPREASHAVEGTDAVPRYYVSAATSSPVLHQKGVSITKGSKGLTFSPTATAADIAGEFIAFSGRLGLYEIASNGTELTQTFMDESVSNDWFQVRPAGTMKLKLLAIDGTNDESPVTIDYWRQPPPVYAPSDVILLPTTEALFLHTVARYYGTEHFDEAKADRYRRDYQLALAECLDAVPSYICPRAPKNRLGFTNLWGSQQ